MTQCKQRPSNQESGQYMALSGLKASHLSDFILECKNLLKFSFFWSFLGLRREHCRQWREISIRNRCQQQAGKTHPNMVLLGLCATQASRMAKHFQISWKHTWSSWTSLLVQHQWSHGHLQTLLDSEHKIEWRTSGALWMPPFWFCWRPRQRLHFPSHDQQLSLLDPLAVDKRKRENSSQFNYSGLRLWAHHDMTCKSWNQLHIQVFGGEPCYVRICSNSKLKKC